MTANLIARKQHPDLKWETITPEMAAFLLSQNTHNRPVRAKIVEQYARDMAEHNWEATGEAIKIADDGTILDGQHRLLACVKSGVAFVTIVVLGVDKKAQDVMDSGVKRQASDALRLAGVQNSAAVAAAIRIAMAMDDDGDRTGKTLPSKPRSHSEILDWFREHRSIEEAGKMGQHYSSGRGESKLAVSPSVLTYVWYTLAKVDHEACVEFFESLRWKATNGKGDPRSALLTRIDVINKSDRFVTPGAYISMFLRTWNLWRKGELLERILVEGRTGEIPPAPEPI